MPLHAEPTNDPLWTLFTSYAVDRDEKASDAPYEGKEDSKRLASLQADLQLLAGGFESFRDESQVKENLVKLEPRITPELRPFFKDRASSLETIYRTLAVTDYTWAARFPSPPCSPAEARRKLLDSRDGLFQNAQGASSRWLVSLLGPQAEGKSAEQALDQASAKNKLGAAEYEKRRSLIRKLTLALASDKAVGEARSRLYCLRASAYEDLAASQGPAASAPTLAASVVPRTAPEPSVFVVVSGGRRAAATMVETKFGPVLVTDAAITAGDDHPHLFAHSGMDKPVELTAMVARRDETLGLATLTFAGTAPALPLATQAPAKDELVTALGHAEVSGLWTKTSGLISKSGPDTFQTDAVVSADFSGGPVLNDSGEVAGLLVQRPADTEEGHWPVAVPARTIALWLEGAQVSPGPASETIEDAGTAAVLSRTRPSLLTKTAAGDRDMWITRGGAVNPPMGNIVCMKYCDSGSSSRSSGSSYSGSSSYSSYSSDGGRELGEALGKLAIVGISALFRGIGKLFKGSDKPAAPRSVAQPTAPKDLPEKPPEPPKITGIVVSVDRTTILEGERVTATATVSFDDASARKDGISIVFSIAATDKAVIPKSEGGYIRTTNSAGQATYSYVANNPRTAREQPFEELRQEEGRRAGDEPISRVHAPLESKKNDFDRVKAKMSNRFQSLDAEESKLTQSESQTTQQPEEFQDRSDALTQASMQSAPTPIKMEAIYALTLKAIAAPGNRPVALGAKLDDEIKTDVQSGACPVGLVAVMASPPPSGGSPGGTAHIDPQKAKQLLECKEIEDRILAKCGDDLSCEKRELKQEHYFEQGCESRWRRLSGAAPGSVGIPDISRRNGEYWCVPAAPRAKRDAQMYTKADGDQIPSPDDESEPKQLSPIQKAIQLIEDIIKNPSRLTGKTPEEIEAQVKNAPGWKIEKLGKGSHEGQGWVLREYLTNGQASGRLFRWHPGGGHHGPGSYWIVTSPGGGKSERIP